MGVSANVLQMILDDTLRTEMVVGSSPHYRLNRVANRCVSFRSVFIIALVSREISFLKIETLKKRGKNEMQEWCQLETTFRPTFLVLL